MFDRFTDRARRVLVLAQEEARLLNHGYIGTEHILLGLLRDTNSVAWQALTEMGITLEGAREKVVETIGMPQPPPNGPPPFTPRAKRVLELAFREALQRGHQHVETGHLLLGVIDEGEGVAAHVLVDLGADLGSTSDAVLSRLRSPENQGRVGGRLMGTVGHLTGYHMDFGRKEQPTRSEPPPGWIGGRVPWHIVLVHTDQRYAELSEFSAFPTGVEFTMRMMSPHAPIPSDPRMVDMAEMLKNLTEGPKLDVQFADGRTTATSLPSSNLGLDLPQPVLRSTGGTGFPSDHRNRWWLWPLPVPGPLTLTVNWHEEGVVDKTIVLDANELISAAAERAERLW